MNARRRTVWTRGSLAIGFAIAIVSASAADLAAPPPRGDATPDDSTARSAVPADTLARLAPGTEGLWEGRLQGMLRLRVHVACDSSGLMTGTVDSPDQGAFGLAIDTLEVTADSMRFVMSGLGARFLGRFSDGGARVSGRWRQSGLDLPLDLSRAESAEEYRRPQDPTRPFPYDTAAVEVENRKARVRLAGTLTIPRGPGPFPAALLISGSGAEDRDEFVFGHRPFLVLADALTRRGIAVLRLDDRGVGGSSGNVSSSTSEDFARDALAAVAFLKTRTEVDRKRIGLIGHSEGGLIAPIAASRSHDVAFVVLLAGPGLPGDSILYSQTALMLRAAGASGATIARERELQGLMLEILGSERDSATAAREIRDALARTLTSIPAEERRAIGDPAEYAEAQARAATSRWFRFFVDYDPRRTLRRVRCPVLALGGEKDLQVPPDENLSAIREALARGGNRDVTVKKLPRLNHLFQTAGSGLPLEYAGIDQTMEPEVMEEVATWILARAPHK